MCIRDRARETQIEQRAEAVIVIGILDEGLVRANSVSHSEFSVSELSRRALILRPCRLTNLWFKGGTCCNCKESRGVDQLRYHVIYI